LHQNKSAFHKDAFFQTLEELLCYC